MNYAKAMRFTDRPDYAFLRGMFRHLFLKEGHVFDSDYDWCKKQRAELSVQQPLPTTAEAETSNQPEPSAPPEPPTHLDAFSAKAQAATSVDEKKKKPNKKKGFAFMKSFKRVAADLGRKSAVVSDVPVDNSSETS
jgi:hypothetical protein